MFAEYTLVEVCGGIFAVIMFVVGILTVLAVCFCLVEDTLEAAADMLKKRFRKKPVIPVCPMMTVDSDGFGDRCFYALQSGNICARHGDVTAACEKFVRTGVLTSESEGCKHAG